MNTNDVKLRFYEFPRLYTSGNAELSKDSDNYGRALKKVINNDLFLIENKVKKIIFDANKLLKDNGLNISILCDSSLDNIEEIIKEFQKIIDNLNIIKEQRRRKIYAFSRKAKKKEYTELVDCVNVFLKYKNDIISIKNEYNKLKNRDQKIVINTNKVINSYEDPLERTIKFYMNKDS